MADFGQEGWMDAASIAIKLAEVTFRDLGYRAC